MTEASDSQTASEADHSRSRRQSILFVGIFVLAVLGFLTGYRYALDTRANDRYLFEVARHTSWVLDKVGHSSALESPRGHRLSPEETRAHIRAHAEDRDTLQPEDHEGVATGPLSRWERYLYRIGEARVREFPGHLGPKVSFVLRPNLGIELYTTESAIERLESQGGGLTVREQNTLAGLREKLEALKTRQQALIAGETTEPRAKVFTFIVVPECGAIEVMAIFFAAVIAFPALWWKRLLGIVVGLPIMYAVNIFRLSCLAVIGALNNGGAWFDFSHLYVWQAIYIVFVVAVWLAWVEYVVRRRPFWDGFRNLARRFRGAPGKRGVLLFCLKFIVLAPVLTAVWWLLIPQYGWFLVQASGSILRFALGEPIQAGWIAVDGLFNTKSNLVFSLPDKTRSLPIAQLVTNIPPYLALVLATTGLGRWRRLRILGYGVAILSLGHILYIVVLSHWQEQLMHATEIPVAVMQFFLTLPFLLWIVFAYWDRLLNGKSGTSEHEEDTADNGSAPPSKQS